MIGAYLSVSIVSFVAIGYCCNHLDGQLNCQVFTHCIIGRATKLSAVQLVIVAWHTFICLTWVSDQRQPLIMLQEAYTLFWNLFCAVMMASSISEQVI